MADVRPADARSSRRPTVPRSFQTRLTFAFIGVVALTLALVAPIVINRIDDYVRQQEEQSLRVRANATAAVIEQVIQTKVGTAAVVGVDADGQPVLNQDVRDLLVDQGLLTFAADNVALADVSVMFGPATQDTDGTWMPDPGQAPRLHGPARRRARPRPGTRPADLAGTGAARACRRPTRPGAWSSRCPTRTPHARRTLAAISGLVLVMAGIAFGVAVLVAAFLAHRFTTPLTRLTEASRRLAEGDLSSRVPADEVASSTTELRALSLQFNQMADRLEQSVSIIRRDRDYSRDFLADVSHELRTPIAAMRTFVELLQGPAGRDPAARAEFLGSSAVQLDRLDWLAQNLLELSKLDSGLVLLDLRPDDVRGTIESAVEQQQPAAERKGIRMTTDLPDRPLRIRHDPPRVGQIVSNLVGNALKFTEPDGSIAVRASRDAGRRRDDRGVRHGRGHRRGGAAVDLRPLLPRVGRERGAQHRLGARPRDREVDRRHAPRDDRGREPARPRVEVRGPAAARSAGGRAGAGRRPGRIRASSIRRAATPTRQMQETRR